jgi:putative 2-oxoglutarate-Fe(II)-dependent oxygenase superfamily protein
MQDTGTKQGWIKFGEPGYEVGLSTPVRRLVQPKVGWLVLFPSYMWHSTMPFHAPRTGGLASWLRDSEFSITMNNVGDEDPPIRLEGGTSSPGNGATGIVAAGGTLGRYTVFTLRKQF